MRQIGLCLIWYGKNNACTISLYKHYSLILQFASLAIGGEAPASVYPRRSFALGRFHMDSLHKLDLTYE